MNNKAVMLGLAVLAFLVAAVLVIMIFRMLFSGRLRMPGGRARQARLGIVDAFDLDRQRQLIIVRRDNTEHLIMIGGPNDVVIESEIVRAEVRDVREQRRDPVVGSPVVDGRIPAPVPALGREQPIPAPDRSAARVEEPVISVVPPAPAPTPPLPAAAEPPRAPTFPLPPRRPPTPERRQPPAPQLPESVKRGEEPSLSGQPVALAPAPPMPTLPPEPTPPPPATAPLPPTSAGPAAAVGPAAATPPRRPPFLKPLSRPPIRPLQRTTPQTPPPGSAPTPVNAPLSPAPPVAASAPPRPAQAPPPPPPPQAAANDESRDALESLEEEMAKLLGRGS